MPGPAARDVPPRGVVSVDTCICPGLRFDLSIWRAYRGDLLAGKNRHHRGPLGMEAFVSCPDNRIIEKLMHTGWRWLNSSTVPKQHAFLLHSWLPHTV